MMVDSGTTKNETIGTEALIARGSEKLRDDKVKDALACFHSALKNSPEDLTILKLVGLSYFKLSDFHSALGVYQQLVDRNTKDASYRLNLGLVHLKLDHPDDAIQELEMAKELDPSQIRTVSYLGLAQARKGAYAEAYECFLVANQDDLAGEMVQYLSDEVRDEILSRVKFSCIPQGLSSKDDDSSEYLAVDVSDESSVMQSEGVELSVSPEPSPSSNQENWLPPEVDSAVMTGGFVSGMIEIGENEETKKLGVDELITVPKGENAVPGESAGLVTQALFHILPDDEKKAIGVVQAKVEQPEPLSHILEQNLIRPSKKGALLELGATGVLVAKVNHRLICRTLGVMVSSGELSFQPATRRKRGQQVDEVFGEGDAQLFEVSGQGYLLLSAEDELFTAIQLRDESVYFRDEYLYAFDPELRWENGKIPGSKLQVTQFRGGGCVAIRTPKKVLSVNLSAERVAYIDPDFLIGWTGKVMPRFVKSTAGGIASTPSVRCSGEGVLLLHNTQGTL